MLRKKLKKGSVNKESSFRFRGTDNTRIEALSDGVFAIATALLIISSSIPETFEELLNFLDDLVPFAICMTLLMLIWYQHYVFFIRYGFKDAKIVAINTFLLFLILFYIYPLKFLFKVLYQLFPALINNDHETVRHLFTNIIPRGDAALLMSIYGLGAATIFFTLTYMYFIAWRRRDRLSLNLLESFDTKMSMIDNLLMASVPTISIIISVLISDTTKAFMYSGIFYMSYAVIMPIFGYFSGKRRTQLINSLSDND